VDASKWNDRTKNLLYVGRICPEKGPEIAIKAVGHLIFEMGITNLKLDLIGGGETDYFNLLLSQVSSLKLEKHVALLGKMDHEQVMESYKKYDIFLFPSIWQEPLGVTFLEAMAQGVVAIVSDRGAPREVITDGINGLIVPGEDPYSLAKAINKILNDQGLSTRLRIEALKTIRDHYLFDHIIDLTEDFLYEIINN
jgi:glycosyltransferase involved in cell wall biosynthesis